MRAAPLLALVVGLALIGFGAWYLTEGGADGNGGPRPVAGPAQDAAPGAPAPAPGDPELPETFDVAGAALPMVTESPEDVQAVFKTCARAAAEDVPGLRLAALRSPDPLVVGNALQALGRLGEVRAGDPLADGLSDARPRVRQETVRALGVTGDPEALALLAPVLEDPDATLRHLAIQAIGGVGTEEARATLEAFEEGADEVERAFLRTALGR